MNAPTTRTSPATRPFARARTLVALALASSGAALAGSCSGVPESSDRAEAANRGVLAFYDAATTEEGRAYLDPKPIQHQPPFPFARPADHLIEAREGLFIARLWQLTFDGENAEAYWSHDGTRLSLQRRHEAGGIDCDQIFVTTETGLERVSNGNGATTCAYFMPGDREVLFASTHGYADGCPPKPDYSQGYVWMLHPEFDIWVRSLDSGELRALIQEPGYDAEATVSPLGDRIVFTSTRSGDPEIYTCASDGTDVRRITNAEGYDGGAFFSHDGQRLVYRRTEFTPGSEAAELEDYRRLMRENKIRPNKLELWICDVDGSDHRKVTNLGGASFAPYFGPSDDGLAFATNFHQKKERNFDLFMVGLDGQRPFRLTTFEGFDGFPMFSPDGRWMAFSSNRGAAQPGETNVFVAELRLVYSADEAAE